MLETWAHMPEQPAEQHRVLIKVVDSSTTYFQKSSLIHGELADGRQVTLKFSTVEEGVNREYEGLSLATKHGISVPEAYAVVTRDEEPSKSVLMQRIQGKTLEEIPNSRNQYMNPLGRELHKLHQIAIDGFGYVTNGKAQYTSAEPYINRMVKDAHHYFYGDEDASNLLNTLWNDVKKSVDKVKPKMIHGDVYDGNLMVDHKNDVVLLDFEFWKGADPMEDLGMYFYRIIQGDRQTTELTELLSGYTNGEELSQEQKLSLLFYTHLYGARTVKFISKKYPGEVPVESLKDMKKVTRHIKNVLEG